LSKATNTDTAIGKYTIGKTPFFQEEDFSFFESSKNGPKIITLLPLNHRRTFVAIANINCKLPSSLAQVFHRELSQIPPTVCVIITKIALKQDFMAFGKALPSHCFVGKIWQYTITCFVFG